MRIRIARTIRRALAGAAIGSALALKAAAAEAEPPPPVAVERTEPQPPAYWGWPETTCPYAGCTPW